MLKNLFYESCAKLVLAGKFFVVKMFGKNVRSQSMCRSLSVHSPKKSNVGEVGITSGSTSFHKYCNWDTGRLLTNLFDELLVFDFGNLSQPNERSPSSASELTWCHVQTRIVQSRELVSDEVEKDEKHSKYAAIKIYCLDDPHTRIVLRFAIG
jgi:hypothetical protein